MTVLHRLHLREGNSMAERSSPPDRARRAQLVAASWHLLGAAAVGLVTAGLTASPAWGLAAAVGDLLLRPQLQLLHGRLAERIFREDSGR